MRPALAIIDAGTRLSIGEVAGVEERLVAAERWIPYLGDEDERAKAEAAGMIVRDTAFLGHLPSGVPLHRAGLARMRGDVAGTIVHAEAALAAAGPRPTRARRCGGPAGAGLLDARRSGRRVYRVDRIVREPEGGGTDGRSARPVDRDGRHSDHPGSSRRRAVDPRARSSDRDRIRGITAPRDGRHARRLESRSIWSETIFRRQGGISKLPNPLAKRWASPESLQAAGGAGADRFRRRCAGRSREGAR